MDEAKALERFEISKLKSQRQTATSRKISEAVFDEKTLMALYKLVKRKAFDELTGIVSTGKEANVYHGLRDGLDVAVKIYKHETSDFRHMSKYVRGDPRFGDWGNRRHLVHMWAQKEYKNIMRVQDLISCPKAIDHYRNVLVMEFIGDGVVPAPKLKEKPPAEAEKYFRRILEYVKIMYEQRLVHADLSEYNILDFGGPVVIDFSAGVLLDHPKSLEFLRRDLQNICNFFEKHGVKTYYNRALEEVLDAN